MDDNSMHLPGNMGSLSPHFVGRNEVIHGLRDQRLAIICGPEGIGKTAAAIEYGHRYGGDYPAGCWLIPCDNHANLQSAIEAMAGLCNLWTRARSASEDFTPGQNNGALFILDNVTGAAFFGPVSLAPLLDTSWAHIIATTNLTREDLPGELAQSCFQLESFSEAESLALMRARAAETEPGGDEVTGLEDMVRQLKGFPLAVELAANLFPISEYDDHSRTLFQQLMDEEPPTFIKTEEERLVTALLLQILKKLRPPELLALRASAFLPPNSVALPWVANLMAGKCPDHQRSKFNSLWLEAQQELLRIGVWHQLRRDQPNLVQMSPMVNRMLRKIYAPTVDGVPEKTMTHILDRAEALMTDHIHPNRQWELEPLAACAWAFLESHPYDGIDLANGVGRAVRKLTRYTEAESLYRGALAAIALDDDLSEWEATTISNLGVLLGETKRFTEAEPLLRRALEIEGGEEDSRTASALNNLAQHLRETGRVREAEPLLRQALEIDLRLHHEDNSIVAVRLSNLGTLLRGSGKYDEAESLLRRALEIDQKHFGENHPNVARDLNNLAGVLKDTNRFSEAEWMIRRALEIDREWFGEDHPLVAIRLGNLAGLLSRSGRSDEAEQHYRRSLEIDRITYGDRSLAAAFRMGNLAVFLLEADRVNEAHPLAVETLKIHRAAFGSDHPYVARDLASLAQILSQLGRQSEAEFLLRRAVEIDRNVNGENSPALAIRLNNLAQLLRETGRLEEAEFLLRQALKIDQRNYGRDHPEVTLVLDNLGGLLWGSGRLIEAEKLLREGLEIKLRFKTSSGHRHPDLSTSLRNYERLLSELGFSKEVIRTRLAKIGVQEDEELGRDDQRCD